MPRFSAELIARQVEEEAVRDSYPTGFPTLPEVPGGRYTDQHFYELEIEHVWKKVWLFAGHIDEIAKPGDYITFDKLGLSIVLVRKPDGLVGAYHNVCRHRGSALVAEASGRVKRFLCPYHSWSYSLDGQLQNVPREYDFGCFHKSSRNLLPVHCTNFRGLLYISVADQPQPFAEFAAGVIEALADFPIEKLSPKGKLRIEVPCNWKALKDNFSESYHVNAVHGQTVAQWLDPEAYLLHTFKNGHHTATTRKRVFERIKSDVVPQLEVADKLYNDHTVGVAMFPNGASAVDPAGFPWITIWPTSRNTSVLEATFLGPDDGRADYSDYWQKHIDDVAKIFAEDLHLMPGLQNSLEGGKFTGMMLSYKERAIYWLHEEIDRRIGASRLPSSLALTQILAPYAE